MKNKLKRITEPGCVYIDGKVYTLNPTDENGKSIDLNPIITKLAYNALLGCRSREKGAINSIVRALASFGVKPSAIAAGFQEMTEEDFNEAAKKAIVPSPVWEISVINFIVGFLTATFIQKNNIQLSSPELELTEEEKETSLRLASASILVEGLAAQGVDTLEAYGIALVKGMIKEEDLDLVCEPDQKQKLLDLIEREKTAIAEKIPEEMKN